MELLNRLPIRFGLLSLLIIIFLFSSAKAQHWQPLGPDDLNQPAYGYTTEASMAVNKNGIPYILIQDTMVGRKATVRKFVENSWVDVGSPGFSAGMITYPHMVIDSNGTPFVIYADAGNNRKATVKKFIGNNWIDVGTAGISLGVAYYTRIAIDYSGTPYIVYIDGGNGFKVAVKKLNNGNWTDVGIGGVSAGEAAYSSIAIDNSGIPYVAYQDRENNNVAIVKKFNGSIWENVSPAGVITASPAYTSIAIDANNTIYLAYKDVSYNIRVQRFNGAGWSDLKLAVQGSEISLAIDNNRQLYVACSNYGGVSVYVFDALFYQSIGETQLIINMPNYTSLAIDSGGNVYVSYNDNSYKAVVKKYTGNRNWITLGEAGGFTRGNNTAMAISSDGTPYVVYKNNSLPTFGFNQLRAKKFNDTAWVAVGSSVGRSDYPASIAINEAGVPYIAYIETSAFAFQVSVRKFDGVIWSYVGRSAFTNWTDHVSLAIDKRGTPYVAYSDNIEYGGKATVKKFDGTDWVNVGTPGFSDGKARYISFGIDLAATPYIAYRDEGNNNKLTVKKFDGNNWQQVGVAGFSDGPVSSLELAVNRDGTLYVLYADEAFNNKAIVKKFNGSSWVTTGAAGFSAGAIAEPSLAINKYGILYVSYIDSANNNKVAVMQFNGSSWVNIASDGLSKGRVAATGIGIGLNESPIVMYAFFDAYAKRLVSNPLPVFQLTGNFMGNNVLLRWRTNEAGSSAPFTIERSFDGSHFNDIGFVTPNKGLGRLSQKFSTVIQHYWFIDHHVTSFQKPVIYYRLWQKDTNGEIKQSNTIAVQIDKPKGFGFRPNPFTRQAIITLNADNPQLVQVRVIDYSGRIRQTFRYNIASGNTSVQLNMSSLEKGIYLLDITGKSIHEQVHIIKL